MIIITIIIIIIIISFQVYIKKNKDYSKYGTWTPVIVVDFNPKLTWQVTCLFCSDVERSETLYRYFFKGMLPRTCFTFDGPLIDNAILKGKSKLFFSNGVANLRC